MENTSNYSLKNQFTLPPKGRAGVGQTNKKGSIHARNLLDMAFKQKVKESYHFPHNNHNNARLVRNDNVVFEDDVQRLGIQEMLTEYQLTNYPNPFNETTTIQAVIPVSKNNAYLVINDLMGREVYKLLLKPGINKQIISNNTLHFGIYIYTIEENGIVMNKQKLVKIK